MANENPKKVRHCSVCKSTSHNRTRCPVVVFDEDVNLSRRRCSGCKSTLHDRRRCPIQPSQEVSQSDIRQFGSRGGTSSKSSATSRGGKFARAEQTLIDADKVLKILKVKAAEAQAIEDEFDRSDDDDEPEPQFESRGTSSMLSATSCGKADEAKAIEDDFDRSDVETGLRGQGSQIQVREQECDQATSTSRTNSSRGKI